MPATADLVQPSGMCVRQCNSNLHNLKMILHKNPISKSSGLGAPVQREMYLVNKYVYKCWCGPVCALAEPTTHNSESSFVCQFLCLFFLPTTPSTHNPLPCRLILLLRWRPALRNREFSPIPSPCADHRMPPKSSCFLCCWLNLLLLLVLLASVAAASPTQQHCPLVERSSSSNQQQLQQQQEIEVPSSTSACSLAFFSPAGSSTSSSSNATTPQLVLIKGSHNSSLGRPAAVELVVAAGVRPAQNASSSSGAALVLAPGTRGRRHTECSCCHRELLTTVCVCCGWNPWRGRAPVAQHAVDAT